MRCGLWLCLSYLPPGSYAASIAADACGFQLLHGFITMTSPPSSLNICPDTCRPSPCVLSHPQGLDLSGSRRISPRRRLSGAGQAVAAMPGGCPLSLLPELLFLVSCLAHEGIERSSGRMRFCHPSDTWAWQLLSSLPYPPVSSSFSFSFSAAVSGLPPSPPSVGAAVPFSSGAVPVPFSVCAGSALFPEE